MAKRFLETNRTGQAPSMDISDKVIMNCFTSIYGSVNFEDPLMQKRLAAIKQTMMEISNKQPKDTEVNLQLFDEGIEATDPLLCPEMLKDKIKGIFTVEEQTMYSVLNPSKSSGEWFLLPRLQPSEIRRQFFPGYDDADEPSEKADNKHVGFPSRRRTTTKSSQKTAIAKTKLNKQPLKNLHLYDPKVEFCRNMSYKFFRYCGENTLPTALTARILERVNEFPFGITPLMFWEKFYQSQEYLPNICTQPLPERFLDILESEMLIFRSKHTSLMFPRFMEGIVHPDIILKRLWHAIKCLLGNDPHMQTDKIFERVEADYGVKFDPLDWGFQSVNAFLSFLVNKYGYKDDITVHRVNYSKDYVMNYVDYLTINSPTLKESLESIHDEIKLNLMKGDGRKRGNKSRIPKGFLRERSSMKAVSNSLCGQSTFYADLKTIHDPDKLIVVNNHPAVRQFHESLQSNPLLQTFNSQPPPDPKRLRAGMYLMAHIDWNGIGEMWFRVKILIHDNLVNKYLVYGIDFGLIEFAGLEDLRYMPRSDIGEEPAHAIPISLYGVTHPSKQKNHQWEMGIVTKILNKHLGKGEENIFKIFLVEGHVNHLLGCKQWSVKCDVVDRKEHKTVCKRFNSVFNDEFKKEFLRRKKTQKSKSTKRKGPTDGKIEAPKQANS